MEYTSLEGETSYTDLVLNEEEELPHPVWDEISARQYGSKLGLAVGDISEGERVAEELMSSGVSVRGDELTDILTEVQNKSILDGGIAAIPDVEDSQIGFVANSMKESYNKPLDLDSLSAAGYGILTRNDAEAAEFGSSIDNEIEYKKKLSSFLSEKNAIASKEVFLEKAADLVGTMIPFVEADTVAGLKDLLVKDFKFNEDASEGLDDSLFFTGSVKSQLRDFIASKSAQEQLGIAKAVYKFVQKDSGLLGSNQLEAMGLLNRLFSRHTGEYIDGTLDADLYIDNTVALLDVIGVGSLVKGVFKTGKTAAKINKSMKSLGGAPEDSLSETVKRIDPDKAADIHGAALADTTEKSAAELGVTKADIKKDSFFYRDPTGKAPLVSNHAIEKSKDAAIKALDDVDDSLLSLRAGEKQAIADSLAKSIDSSAGYKIWLNGSTIKPIVTKVGDKAAEVTAFLGKSSKSLFRTPDEVLPIVSKLKRKYSTKDTKLEVVAIDYAGNELKLASNSPAALPKKPKLDINGNVLVKGDKTPLNLTESGDVQRKIQTEKNKLQLKANLSQDAVVKESLVDKIKSLNEDISNLNKGNLGKLSEETKKLVANPSNHLNDAQKLGVNDFDSSSIKGYAIKIKREQDFSFDNNNIKFEAGEVKTNTNVVTRYFNDISSTFSPDLSGSILSADDRGARLTKLLKDILQPLYRAPRKSRQLATSWAKKGNADAREYTVDELIGAVPKGFSPHEVEAAIQAYQSIRLMADTSHVLLNRLHYKALTKEGYKHVKVGEWQVVGKPLDTVELGSKAYDPVANKVITLTKEHSSLQRVVMRDPIGKTDNQTVHAIIDPGSIHELPQQVLNRRDGYIPRNYNENFYVTIRMKTQTLDDKIISPDAIRTKAIAVAKSSKQAEAMAKSMAKDYGDDWVVATKNDRAFTPEEMNAKEFDIEQATGGLFYSRREEHLKHLDGELADTDDVLSSLETMATAVANKHHIEPVNEMMKERWMNTWGEKFSITVDGKPSYPRKIEDIQPRDKKFVSNEDLDTARTAWFQMNKNMDNDPIHSKWRQLSVRLGDFISDKTFNGLGYSVGKTLTKADPIKFLRGSAFTTMIALNPARQLFIQSQQFLFLALVDGAASHILTGKGTAQGMALIKASTKDADTVTSALARASGMPTDEFRAMSKGLDESGLLTSIDTNMLGRDAVMSMRASDEVNGFNNITDTSFNAYRSVTTGVKAVGFDLGERVNLSVTYSLAWKRAKDKGLKMDDKKTLKLIAEDTRQLALSMTSPGAFKYQKGLLSLGTQFLSVQNKAWLVMLGKNKHFTKSESKRILWSQLALYGSSGWGINTVVNSAASHLGIEMNDTMQEIINGGAIDYTINSALEAATGSDDIDLSFASNMAAGGGLVGSVENYIKLAVENPFALAFGPSTNLYSKAGRLATATNMMFRLTPEDAKIGSDGQARRVIEAATSIASGFNNMHKGMAMNRTGHWVKTNLAQLPIESTQVEALAAGILGVQDYKISGVFDYWKSVSEKKDNMKDNARDLADMIERVMQDNPDTMTSLDKLAKLGEYAQSAHMFYGEEAPFVIREAQKILSKRKSFYDTMLTAVNYGNIGDDTRSIALKAKNSGLLDDTQYENLLKLDGYIKGEE